MFYFKDEFPSCASCEYATVYIPYFTYPHSNPYCSKGHGQCEVDKLCGDYKLINSHYCCECEYYSNGFCDKRKENVKEKDYSCAYYEKVI